MNHHINHHVRPREDDISSASELNVSNLLSPILEEGHSSPDSSNSNTGEPPGPLLMGADTFTESFDLFDQKQLKLDQPLTMNQNATMSRSVPPRKMRFSDTRASSLRKSSSESDVQKNVSAFGSFVDRPSLSRDMEDKIIREGDILRFSGSLLHRKGTAFLKKARTFGLRHWFTYFFWVVFVFFIQLFVGLSHVFIVDGDMPTFTCVDIGRDNKAICELKETLREGTATFAFLSSFILGGFLCISVKLWLLRRSNYAKLLGATRALLFNICSFVPITAERVLVVRWVVLSFELSLMKGRGMLDHLDCKSYLEELHLIRNNEWDLMVTRDRHTTVLYWIQEKAYLLSEAGIIDKRGFQTICKAVTVLRGSGGDLMSHPDRDIPPPCVFVCALIVNSNLFVYCLGTGLQWGIWWHESNGISVWMEPRMIVDLLLLFSYTTIYAMIFDACSILFNPFGPRSIDIAHYKEGSQIRYLAKKLQSNSMRLPEEDTATARNEDGEFVGDDEGDDEDDDVEAYVFNSDQTMALMGARRSVRAKSIFYLFNIMQSSDKKNDN